MMIRITTIILGMLASYGFAPIRVYAESHALLVGVSHYPHLAERYGLQGPENDVRLMQDLLVTKFSFASGRVRVLSEATGASDEALLPNRVNIEREFLHLAEVAQSGDEVVIFMAGHGSQQPEQKGGEPEIDGLDEIFLPRDVAQWQQEAQIVPNAIVDNEIASWLKAIQEKGAHLWVIFDCCHSGDMTRGEGEVNRSVDPSEKDCLAIPVEAIRAARRLAAERTGHPTEPTRGGETSSAALQLTTLENLAVFYACQSHEKAIELPFPSKPEEMHFGLFTHSLCAVLAKTNRPLSYRELSRGIYREYVAAGRVSGPTPLVEGAGVDRAVLGSDTIERAQIVVTLDPDDESGRALKIDAGQLHGITVDSVLAVSSPGKSEQPSSAANPVVGHIRVTDVSVADASVVPCEYGKFPKKTAKTLAGGYCDVIEINYGELRLPVMVELRDTKGDLLPKESVERLETLLRDLAAETTSLVTVVANPSVARCFVRVQNGGVILVLPQSQRGPRAPTVTEETLFGPFKMDEGLRENLASSLTRIARVENLMRLASNVDGEAGNGRNSLHPRIQIAGHIIQGDRMRPISDLPKVQPANVLDMSVKNIGEKDLDLTVLYVNNQMGIGALYPGQNSVNRFRPGQTKNLPLAEFTSGPFGRGHFVFIAVEAEGQPTDFTWLAQKSIPAERDNPTPLGALLANALFGVGKTRSASSSTSCHFDILPVDVLPAP